MTPIVSFITHIRPEEVSISILHPPAPPVSSCSERFTHLSIRAWLSAACSRRRRRRALALARVPTIQELGVDESIQKSLL